MELLTVTDTADHTADDKDDGPNYWTDNDSISSIERVAMPVKEISNNISSSFKRAFFFAKSKTPKTSKKIIEFLKYDPI